MTLKFYNTPTGNVEEFISQTPNKALVYTCGPTVYNYPHIGNWASYIYWDTLIRILMANDYEVTRVMNITDVGHLTSDSDEGEDKLQNAARKENKTAWEIAKYYTDDFIAGMKKLGLVAPQHMSKATDHIQDQIDLIIKLKEKGYTYQINDGVYFDTSKFPSYANFAKLNLESLKAGARVEFNPEKRNHSDFALWKFTSDNTKRDMEWEFEGRMGFPGWHLECSAISMSLLGDTIDIHTGGIDHIPVHHTNEIAQSEAATGVRFSNYWLHNDFLKVNGTKISKSLGNAYTLSDIEKHGFSPLDFRMFVLQGHYRNEGNFTFEGLESAKNRLNNWRNVATLRHQTNDTLRSDKEVQDSDDTIKLYATPQAIIQALNDDIGSPEALKIIDEAFARVLGAKLKNIDQQSLVQLLETIDHTLGLQLIESTPDITDDIKQIIIERNSARDQKDWVKSDKLRNDLLESKIILRDNSSESIWERIN